MVAGTSPIGGMQEAAGRCFSLIDVSNSLSLSLPLCKKSIKIYIFKKINKSVVGKLWLASHPLGFVPIHSHSSVPGCGRVFGLAPEALGDEVFLFFFKKKYILLIFLKRKREG